MHDSTVYGTPIFKVFVTPVPQVTYLGSSGCAGGRTLDLGGWHDIPHARVWLRAGGEEHRSRTAYKRTSGSLGVSKLPSALPVASRDRQFNVSSVESGIKRGATPLGPPNLGAPQTQRFSFALYPTSCYPLPFASSSPPSLSPPPCAVGILARMPLDSDETPRLLARRPPLRST